MDDIDDDLWFVTGLVAVALWLPLFWAAGVYAERGYWEPEWTPLLVMGVVPGFIGGLVIAALWWRKRG